MAFYKGGASLNWEYLPEDFKTETEVVDDLEKKCKANPNHILPPRKQKQTKPFGSTAITKKAATKKIESVKVKHPVHPRLYNIASINNNKKTVAVSEHKVTKAAFQYLCTFEESKSKMWLCAEDVGDAQIGKYWETFEYELGGYYEWEEIEDCQPVKDGIVSSKAWQLMKHKADVAIEGRKKKMAFEKIVRKVSLESTPSQLS